MKIIDNIADGLYLGPSTIPGSGVGLFTSKDIGGGVPVAEYKGDVFEQNPADMEKLYARYNYTLKGGLLTRELSYSIAHPPSKSVIDCHPIFCQSEIGLGGFVNDAQTFEQRQDRPESLDNTNDMLGYWLSAGYNGYFWFFPNQPRAYVLSFRGIKAGEEIFVDYGDDYWKTDERRKKENEIDKPLLKEGEAGDEQMERVTNPAHWSTLEKGMKQRAEDIGKALEVHEPDEGGRCKDPKKIPKKAKAPHTYDG